MTKYIKFRFDSTDTVKIASFCDHYGDCFLYACENVDSENPHSHGYLKIKQRYESIQALRQWARKNIGKGNGAYSIKELDEEYPIAYLAYIIKENRYVTDIPDEVMDEVRLYDEKVKTEMSEKKKSRRSQLQILTEIIQTRIDEDDIDIYPQIVADIVINYYMENDKLIREFQIISLVQTLVMKFNEEYRRLFRAKICSRMFETL